MIDWITAIVDFDHTLTELENGFITSTDTDGVILWETRKALFDEGSFSTKVLIKSHAPSAYEKDGVVHFSQVYIDGNPAKYLLGHNVFGSNDLLLLSYKFFLEVFKNVELVLNDIQKQKIKNGSFLLNRVDCTDYLVFKDQCEVDLVLNRLADTGTYKNRGNATSAKGTVYFGQRSTWFAVKFYNKYKELHKHQIKQCIPDRDKIKDWSLNKLRCELVLRSRELQKIDMRSAKNWKKETVMELLSNYVNSERINLTTTADLSDEEILLMPRKLRSTYALWKSGIDTNAVMSITTWYVHRNELLSFGIDISTKPPKDDNVINIKKTVYINWEFCNKIPSF